MNPEFEKDKKSKPKSSTAGAPQRLAPIKKRKGKIPGTKSESTSLKAPSGSAAAPDDIIEAKTTIANRSNRSKRSTQTSHRVKRNENPPKEEDDIDDKKDEGSPVLLTSLQHDSSEELSPQPGSYAVFDSLVDEEAGQGAIEVSSPPSDPVITEAELVDAEAERERLEADRTRIRNEAFKEIVENATPAEVVDDSMERKRRRQLIVALVCLSVISIIVAVSLGVVLGTKDDAAPTIEEFVRAEFGDDPALDEEGTPQYQSVDWMANNDTSLVWPLETEEDRALFRQRYAMCVLSFSTDIDNWDNRARWLEPISECRWSGLTCDNNGRLIGISVGKW